MARVTGSASPSGRPRAKGRPKGRDRSFPSRPTGIILLALAFFSAISVLSGDGAITLPWRRFLTAAFGWGSYLTPPLLGAFGLAFLWPAVRPGYRFQVREAAGWLLVFGFFLTLFQMLNATTIFVDRPVGGGAVGGWVVGVLDDSMGMAGTLAIAIVAGALGVMLAAGLGLRELGGTGVLLLILAGSLSRAAWAASRRLGRLLAGGSKRLLSRPAPIRRPKVHFKINRTEDGEVPGAGERERLRLTREERRRGAPEISPEVGVPVADPAPKAKDGKPIWQLPPLTLCEAGGEGAPSEADIRQKVTVIEETLRDFGVVARVVEVNPGPVVTQFGLDPGFRERRDRAGNVTRRDKVKVGEITKLRDDLALALAARTVRIEAPVPGRAVIGLEIPNSTASLVHLRRVIETNSFQRVHTKSKLALALGLDVSGGAVAADLTKMPHLLIAGATGAGKSVCMNAIVSCILLHATPDEVRLVMIDPKRVELTSFREIPHLLRSVVVDPEQAVTVLRWMVHEMETRLKRFEAHGVRNIDGYHRLMHGVKDSMPHIVVLIDELADLMMSSADEVERSICRLAQLARATGIHLVIATQRPSVDVVTGLIKANFPTRISFAVASQVDSRTILDSAGAEQLLGSGDMLYMAADAPKPRRLQGVFVGDEEVKRLVLYWRAQGPPSYVGQLEEARAFSKEEEAEDDPIYERAVELCYQHTRVSTSLLQRRLNVGYNRAARLIDLLEERGVISSGDGRKPREVFQPEEGVGAGPPKNLELPFQGRVSREDSF